MLNITSIRNNKLALQRNYFKKIKYKIVLQFYYTHNFSYVHSSLSTYVESIFIALMWTLP